VQAVQLPELLPGMLPTLRGPDLALPVAVPAAVRALHPGLPSAVGSAPVAASSALVRAWPPDRLSAAPEAVLLLCGPPSAQLCCQRQLPAGSAGCTNMGLSKLLSMHTRALLRWAQSCTQAAFIFQLHVSAPAHTLHLADGKVLLIQCLL